MDSPHIYNEKELLLRIAEGSERAFAQLIDNYASLVYGYLLRFVKNAHLAQELSQDVFLKIWNHRARLPDLENFAGYLYVTLRNTASNAFKEKLYGSEAPPADNVAGFIITPALALEYKELSTALNKAIDQMPPKRREVFMLSRIEGLTYEEIASKLNISKNTVREHIIEALAFLRTYVGETLGIIVSAIIFGGY